MCRALLLEHGGFATGFESIRDLSRRMASPGNSISWCPTRNGHNDALLKRGGRLDRGLNARLTLVAVHTVRMPSVRMPAAVHAHLVEQLEILPAACPVPVNPQVVLGARQHEGFCQRPEAGIIVLLGARKHWGAPGKRSWPAAWLGTGIKCTVAHRIGKHA